MEKVSFTTEKGSTVEVNGLKYRIAFDWLEEGGCVDCEPVYEDGLLVWNCDYCDGGHAELMKNG